MNKSTQIKITKGGKFSDSTGTIKFINDFTPGKYKRFYQIEFDKKGMIRAFHGHMKESKAVYVLTGSALLCIAKLTDKTNPSKKIKPRRLTLSSDNPQICIIPPGYANGIESLAINTRVIFFSDKTLRESEKDDYRFPFDYWGEKVWEIE